MPTKLKPYNPSRNDLKSFWHVVDAEGQVLGRIASDIAIKLMGKHRPDYVPHMLSGDFVIVINADKIRVSGRKSEQKVYRRHSGYPGGIKEVPYARVMERTPARVIEHAVRGMLPKNKLGNRAIRRLKVYAGPEHPHEAQVTGSERAMQHLDPVIDLDEIELMDEDQSVRPSGVVAKGELESVAAVAASEETPAEADDDESTVDEPSAADALAPVVEESDEAPAEASAPDSADDTSGEDDSIESSATVHDLSDLGIGARVTSALTAEGITTVDDVIAKSDEELLGIKGFGARSLEELRAALADAGHERTND